MFNPWVILVAVAVAGMFGWYERHAGYEEAMAENAAQVATANERSRQTEEKLSNTLADNATQLRKAQKNADKKIEILKSSLGDGSVRLSLPTQGCVPTPEGATPASGDSGEGRAELDRQTAQNLVSITADGDTAIRKHAACVDAYNEVREQINANR
jgi:hypothetical protein